MNIYTSERALPYVYLCTHKETGEFYFGYREANTRCSHLDLPRYKTSSRVVKSRFEDFDWIIVAEFFNGRDAYDFEQSLIHSSWGNELLLNKSCYFGGARFRMVGPRSEETKRKISAARQGQSFSEETRKKMSEAKLGRKVEFTDEHKKNMRGRVCSEETKRKIAESKLGIPRSKETKEKMSKTIRERNNEKLFKQPQP